MVPTVGRIVHYRVGTYDDPAFLANGVQVGDVLPAIIVRVWSDTCVQLRVFNDSADAPLWKTSVLLGDDEGKWCWPPRG